MSTTHSLRLGDRGRLVVPAELRQRQQWEQGTALIAVETEAGVLFATREQLKARVRSGLAGLSLSDELARERRTASAVEDRKRML